MDRATAIAFLEQHQPMPDDTVLNELPDVMTAYDEARKYFLENPDPICIRLFLNSFGSGSGYGMYQIIEDVLWKFAHEIVIPQLVDALEFGAQSTIFWNAQICASYPDIRLLPALAKILNHEDSDERWAAIMALETIGGSEVFNLLLQRLLFEKDNEIIDYLQEVLREL